MMNDKQQDEWTVAKNKRAEVWQHLLINKKNEKLLKCKHCDTAFKLHQTTTSYRYHMEHKHNLLPLMQLTSQNVPQSTTISSFFKNNENKTISPANVLAKLTALDRIPFATLANSEEIKKGWKAQGLKIPLTEKGMRDLVVKYAQEMREHIKSELWSNIQKSERYSLSLDEWTSKGNRRYMALNLHDKNSNVIGLGLIRVKDSLPATKAIKIVNKKLREYNIDSSKHILAIITDGASVMKCMARLMGIHHQICHSHGLHLAVVDVLYKNKYDEDTYNEVSTDNQKFTVNPDNPENYTEENDSNFESDDNEQEEQENETDLSQYFIEEIADIRVPFKPQFINIIQKIRKIVKMFRKSPLRNDLLQKACQDKFSKELKLILDSPTRWNSLLHMLKRFLELKDVVKTILQELSLVKMYPISTEIDSITKIVESLDVIEASTLALGRRDCNLTKAGCIFDFLHDKLKQQISTPIGVLFYESIQKRVNERRLLKLEKLLEYLEAPHLYLEKNARTVNIPMYYTQHELAETATELHNRLFDVDICIEIAEEHGGAKAYECETGSTKKQRMSSAEELQELLHQRNQFTSSISAVSSSTITLVDIKRQMNVFEHTNVRPTTLAKIYNALLSVPPTSIEVERSFSAAGLFVSNLRTSLKDETIDSLCFLRANLSKYEHFDSSSSGEAT